MEKVSLADGHRLGDVAEVGKMANCSFKTVRLSCARRMTLDVAVCRKKRANGERAFDRRQEESEFAASTVTFLNRHRRKTTRLPATSCYTVNLIHLNKNTFPPKSNRVKEIPFIRVRYSIHDRG